MVTAVAEANAEAAVPWEISPNSDTSTTHELERQLASASRAVDRARRNNLYRGCLFSHGSTLMAPPSSAVLAPQQLLPPSLHEFRVLVEPNATLVAVATFAGSLQPCQDLGAAQWAHVMRNRESCAAVPMPALTLHLCQAA